MTEFTGSAAAVCKTFAFIPQAVRVWRTRSAEDISLAMYLIFALGVVLWIAYGARIHSRPLVAANSVSLVLVLAVVAGTLRFTRLN